MVKIGIFGGTFNPIHYGHLRIAEEVYERFSLNNILFIPSNIPPLKEGELIDARHRYEMVRISITGNPHFDISDIEVKSHGKSYSVETISKLSEIYKGAEFFFILGIDAFFDLPRWRQPERLISLTNLIVVSRPGFSFSSLSSFPYLSGINKESLKELDKGAITGFSFNIPGGKKAVLCNVTGLDISASHIRNMVRRGKNIKYLLPDSVESYIISNRLYMREG